MATKTYDTFDKQDWEEFFISVEYADACTTGESLTSATCVVTAWVAGTVMTSTMAGTPSVSGTVATVMVKAGTTGLKYLFKVRGVTTLAQRFQKEILCTVVEEVPSDA
jgi:hypothetical protein